MDSLDMQTPSEEEPADPRNGVGVHLSWAGRSQARLAIPKPRILETASEFSDVTAEDPGNLLIEGDNRQAMVSLLPQFAGRIDICLIDPPYNTGRRDLRYDDARFTDPDADTTQGQYVSAEDGGRHAKWLNQMAPTLRIIKDLLAPHGVIFVHISDIELPRLLLLMGEIFQERNHLGTLVWKSATDNNPSLIAIEHEYIVCFARNRESLPSTWRGPMGETRLELLEEFERLRQETNDRSEIERRWKAYMRGIKSQIPVGLSLYDKADLVAPYRGGDLQNPGKEGYHYDVRHPLTGKVCKEPFGGYRLPEDGMNRLIADDRVVFGKDETVIVQLKRYLTDQDGEPLRSVIDAFGGKAVNADIRRLFPENPDVFKNPKPVGLEEYLLSFVADKAAVVLDCFAGSGTTGHAVMRLNKRDAGQRRFILIDEGKEGDPYVTSLTAERLRRARVQEGLPGGFTFMRVGDKIDADNLATLQHRQIVEIILQTDATGRGGRITPVAGAKYVIGHNSRREAICLHYEPDKSPVSRDILREMYVEAEGLGLAQPLRVYGARCEVYESEGFHFFKLPDEVATNLVMSLRSAS